MTREEDPFEYATLKEDLLIGSRKFVEVMTLRIGKVAGEQPDREIVHRLVSLVSLDQIVAIIESQKMERREDFHDRRGDWGKGLILYLARKRNEHTRSGSLVTG